MTRRLAPAGAGTMIIAALLAGCAMTPTTSPTPTPTSAASAPTASPPEPTTSAEPTAAPADVTCDDVLTDAEYASLEADGLVPRTENVVTLGPVMADLADEGALVCNWAKPQSDIAMWVVRLPESDAAWQARRDELLAAGWTEGDEPLPSTLTAPADYDSNYIPAIGHADGVTYFVSGARFLTSIAALG
ncbi:hypothetical protein ACFPER_04405 [Agromyces aurantiacus]|uniref:DUF3558 domain-containing protein n=1 Tax=Agromyces aurantiacus TaxID=165814 RepID=A0ABV9R3J8_9MICO|nr:hypothetical protein [Agromyces aurantiacus]MBM7502699.1 hypothetical protein [Agromyces aurantiacus]